MAIRFSYAGMTNSRSVSGYNQSVSTRDLLSAGRGLSILDIGRSFLQTSRNSLRQATKTLHTAFRKFKTTRPVLVMVGNELITYLICIGFLVAVFSGC